MFVHQNPRVTIHATPCVHRLEVRRPTRYIYLVGSRHDVAIGVVIATWTPVCLGRCDMGLYLYTTRCSYGLWAAMYHQVAACTPQALDVVMACRPHTRCWAFMGGLWAAILGFFLEICGKRGFRGSGIISQGEDIYRKPSDPKGPVGSPEH